MVAKPKSPLDAIFPPAEAGPATMPTSLRFSRALLARIDDLAQSRGVTRTEAIERLLNYVLDLTEPTIRIGTPRDEILARRRRRAGK